MREALRGQNINAMNAALRIIDEYVERQKKHLRMGRVKTGDFLQVNNGSVVPIALDGVILLEVDDVQPENPEKT